MTWTVRPVDRALSFPVGAGGVFGFAAGCDGSASGPRPATIPASFVSVSLASRPDVASAEAPVAASPLAAPSSGGCATGAIGPVSAPFTASAVAAAPNNALFTPFRFFEDIRP